MGGAPTGEEVPAAGCSWARVLSRCSTSSRPPAGVCGWWCAWAWLRDDNAKLTQVLSRVAFDLIVYVHARANEIMRETGEDILIELHSSDQSTGGKAMRGCGIVFCDAGRAIVARVLGFVSYEQ